MTGKDVLPEEKLLEKPATMKRFEYLLLGKELKNDSSAEEKQYQSFHKIFKYEEKEEPVKVEKEELVTTSKSKLVYNNKYSSSEYKYIKKYMDDSFKTKCNKLVSLYRRLSEFKKHNPQTERTMIKKKNVYDNAIKLYNRLLSVYCDD